MYLDINNDDYDSKIIPFIRNGIIIDTTVFLKIIDGLVCTRISKKESSEFEKILKFLDALKLTEKWDKFFITPHILTEVCTHLHNDYDSRKDVVSEIMPIIKNMGEHPVSKDDFIGRKEKVAFLSNDRRVNEKYKDHPYIMVMDYQSAILNAL
jgi:predicted nucleic-acid-binding protein